MVLIFPPLHFPALPAPPAPFAPLSAGYKPKLQVLLASQAPCLSARSLMHTHAADPSLLMIAPSNPLVPFSSNPEKINCFLSSDVAICH